jgi:hypothetical protein
MIESDVVRGVLLAAIGASVIVSVTELLADQTQVQYCALYSGGNQQCDFPTFESCQQSASGLGGMCVQTSVDVSRQNLLQRIEQQRLQNLPPQDLPGGTWVPPPPND